MPRPYKDERKHIEARRNANQKLRDEAAEREARISDRVNELFESALVRQSQSPKKRPDIDSLLEELEEGRQLALITQQPNAAISASMAKAKLMGLIVDQSAVLHANANVNSDHLRGDVAQNRADVMRELRSALGPAGIKQLALDEGFTIDGEAVEESNDDDD